MSERQMFPFLLSAMLALSGCNSTVQPEYPNTVKTATQTNNPVLNKESYQEIARYPIKAQGEFQTQTGRVRWMNYTDFTLNPRPLEQLFRYYQEWSAVASTLQIPWQKQTLTATLTRRPNRSTDFYLIPAGISVPAWWTTNPDAGTRVYYFSQNYEEATTIVRINKPVTSFASDTIGDVMYKDPEFFLAVEACQSSVRLEARGVDYRALQETFCNSAGVASFMTKNNYSYALYTKFIGLVPMHDQAGRPIFLLPFTQSRYDAFSKERIVSSN